MNSKEIEELLLLKEYILTVDEYMKILWTSPQIRSMETKEDGSFNLKTDDNYDFTLKVKDEKSNKIK